MAQRSQPVTPGVVVGIGAAALIPALILVTGGAVVFAAETGRGFDAADWAALRFTLWQAALSAALSVALAVPVARALARRQFPGRALLITLLGAPFLLPTIVAIFGLVAIFGRSGVLNDALRALGLPEVAIYGPHGVVLAHVFYNLPLATRLILQGWQDIPSERFRLAASLGMEAGAVNRHLERPMLARVLPGAFVVIFVICTTSFAVALTLGGGPAATTVELAIYQALRFEFDLSRAALLSVVQLVITALAALVALRFAGAPGFGAGRDRPQRRWDARGRGALLRDACCLVLAALFLILPLGAATLSGLGTLFVLPASVWEAAGRSILVALCSTGLTVAAAVSMATAAVHLGPRGRLVETAALLAVAASPLVMGTGLFVLLFPIVDPSRMALPVTALVNSAVTIPFALRAILPAYQTIEGDYGRLATTLGLNGWQRMRVLVLPRLRRPIGFAAGLAAALSMGDLGVIALFADPDAATLPLQVYRLMGAYRMQDAAGAALLLMLLSFGLFWLFDRGGRGNAEA